ncbi:hypothetical protein LEP1GSC115_5350 [Leptospira interrogans serovar Australis str. 200703203]|uniref:Uncharacterized protein n=2 Tax=Leptospira interrogans TaxID=173 RepID=M6H8C8_LEPIR|nr:hypothetical protein LEP1GSC158_4406 [Leptospira interrogans serovar Zanoni str. LT2156]EMN73412.1 hypothetical protein LEP1GSC100_2269 [Leptospira interrogans serovar Bataviae str. UI 08561]EMY23493.1 hypothetical protein LEP1GSC115_5350 [Leptospira interrogans serovar Australis str. 200703203]
MKDRIVFSINNYCCGAEVAKRKVTLLFLASFASRPETGSEEPAPLVTIRFAGIPCLIKACLTAFARSSE